MMRSSSNPPPITHSNPVITDNLSAHHHLHNHNNMVSHHHHQQQQQMLQQHNNYQHYQHGIMSTNSVPYFSSNSVPKGAYFTSIDISDAFHHIPIHTRFQKYLAFTHEGKLFFFQAMPFGINIGPRIFSLIATEAVKYLHNIGISASVYIDDWLLWNRSPRALTLHTSTTVNLPQKLGFTLNLKKSLL